MSFFLAYFFTWGLLLQVFWALRGPFSIVSPLELWSWLGTSIPDHLYSSAWKRRPATASFHCARHSFHLFIFFPVEILLRFLFLYPFLQPSTFNVSIYLAHCTLIVTSTPRYCRICTTNSFLYNIDFHFPTTLCWMWSRTPAPSTIAHIHHYHIALHCPSLWSMLSKIQCLHLKNFT